MTVVRPLRRDAHPREAHARTIALVRERAGAPIDVVWLYTPMMLGIADGLDPDALVYDCMDDLASFAQAPADLVARERELLERADLVFCGGRTLYERRRSVGTKVRLYPSGVDVSRFRTAQTLEPHMIIAYVSHEIFTYTGVIDERVDLETIALLADAEPAGNVVMVGPFAKIDPVTLPRRPNVHFTGIAAYADLPSFLAGTDVALMPFALNEATRSISPTKTLEYFAAGVPVASTPIADVVAEYEDIAYIGEPGAAFVDAARKATLNDPLRRERAQHAAARADWDAIAASMWRDVAPSLERVAG